MAEDGVTADHEVAGAGNGAAYVNDDNFRQEVFESALPVLVDFTAT